MGQVADQADADVVVAARGVEGAGARLAAPARSAADALAAVPAAVVVPDRDLARRLRRRQQLRLARMRQAIGMVAALVEPAGLGGGLFPGHADHGDASGLLQPGPRPVAR